MLLNPVELQSKIKHYGKQQVSNDILLDNALLGFSTYPGIALQSKAKQLA